MLRRRLFLMLGPWVAAMFILGVVLAVLLHGVLADLAHVSNNLQAGAHVQLTLAEHATRVEVALGATPALGPLERQTVLARLEMFEQALKSTDSAFDTTGELAARRTHIDQILSRLGNVLSIAGAADKTPTGTSVLSDARSLASELRQGVREFGSVAQEHVARAQQAALRSLRVIVLLFILGFIVMINVSIVLLLRAASYVVAPVEAMVQATHVLPEDAHSVQLEYSRNDEFGMLARSFNHMAREIERSEQRKLETLHQAACTLSHELNNAISIVDLQLELISRKAPDAGRVGVPVERARESLAKMTAAVDSLRRIQRVVLTDYVPGVTMLDLQQSAQEQGIEPEVTVSAPSKPIKRT